MTAADQTITRSSTVYAVLLAVAACHMINDTLQAVLLSIYPMLRDSYALSFTQVGAITMTFQVTGSVLQPIIGQYTDRNPLPYSLPLAPTCTLIGLVLLTFATSYHAILLAAGMIGIGSSIFHPEASRVTRLSSGGRFGFAQSVFQVGGNLGTSIGPLLAALFIIPHGQRSILWVAILALASIALLSYASRWYASHLGEMKAKVQAVQKSALPRRTIIMSLAILVLLMFSKFVYTASLGTFFTFYLIDHFKVGVQDAQYYLFIYLFSFAAGTFLGGPIGDKIGRKAVIWFSVLGALPFTLALPYANLFWTVALTVPIGFILASAFSAMVVYAQEMLPGRVGMISGLFFGLAFGFGGLGAALLGVLADRTSISVVYHICSFLPAIGLLTMFLPNTEQLRRPA
jgi:MFS transporter, FSR family, fosmidomycin resistance protein